MAVDEVIARLRSTVENARSMPMSSSAVINRSEVLDLIGRLEAELPAQPPPAEAGLGAAGAGAGAGAGEGNGDGDSSTSEAHTSAERIVAAAKEERDRLVSEAEIFAAARREADRVREEAASEAEALRKDTDDYVDRRLANFEITLTKILEAVSRGRTRLRDRSELDQSSLDAAAESEEDPFG